MIGSGGESGSSPAPVRPAARPQLAEQDGVEDAEGTTLAPVPSASVSTAVTANTGLARSPRSA